MVMSTAKREDMRKVSPELLERAIARHPQAVRELLGVLAPVLQARVARVLIERGAGYHVVRQETLDLVQYAYLCLLENDGHLLRSWDPTRGMSFENYCGLIAEQRASQILRSRSRRPWSDNPVDPEAGSGVVRSDNPERSAESKEALQVIFARMRAELTDLGLQLFEKLFVEELSVAEVCVEMNMTESAVYAWRSRLGRRIEQIAREVLT